MTEKKALEVLKEYNSWRQGADTKMIDPETITEAIDTVIRILEKEII